MKRSTWALALVLGALLLAPQAVLAAVGTFSSSTSATALNVTNSGSGRAMTVVSKTNQTAVFANRSTSGPYHTIFATQNSPTSGASAVFGRAVGQQGAATSGVYGSSDGLEGRGVNGIATTAAVSTNYGVFGTSNGRGVNASGVFGYAAGTTGSTNGVFGRSVSDDGKGVLGVGQGTDGVGVLGAGPLAGLLGSGALGVAGDSGGVGAIGNGTYGVLSFSDLGTSGQLVEGGTDIAKSCSVTSGTSAICTFTHPFGSAPFVFLTPTSNPGASFWVSGTTTSQFQINLSSSSTVPVSFNYLVIGVDPNIAPAATNSVTTDYAASPSVKGRF